MHNFDFSGLPGFAAAGLTNAGLAVPNPSLAIPAGNLAALQVQQNNLLQSLLQAAQAAQQAFTAASTGQLATTASPLHPALLDVSTTPQIPRTLAKTPLAVPPKVYQGKLALCKYHLHGCCHKGLACEFAHDQSELSPLAAAAGKPAKTAMCKFFERNDCRSGDRCIYAHSLDELRTPWFCICGFRNNAENTICGGTGPKGCKQPYNPESSMGALKTAMCHFFKAGNCTAGDNCQYAHHKSEIGKSWICNCGYRNGPQNFVCGGAGEKGCKAMMTLSLAQYIYDWKCKCGFDNQAISMICGGSGSGGCRTDRVEGQVSQDDPLEYEPPIIEQLPPAPDPLEVAASPGWLPKWKREELIYTPPPQSSQPSVRTVDVMKARALSAESQMKFAMQFAAQNPSAGQQPAGGTSICSVHGRKRTLQNMCDDGNGRYRCAPGHECGQTGKLAPKPLMPGDWLCPGCGDHQFQRNAICRQCGTPNPEPSSRAQSTPY